jgi:hypothetical protein
MRLRHDRGARAGLAAVFLALACEPADPPDSDLPLPAESIPSGCPPAPPGMTAEAVEAIETINRIRRAAGLSCVEQVPEIAHAAERHCRYYVANAGPCIAQPHREAASCTNFVAETFGDRLRAAGYTGHPRFEVMAYVGDGSRSVRLWLHSVWHRIPLLSPDIEQAGYGAAGRCDTVDFGVRRDRSPSWQDVIYPADGQTDVPRLFSGRESPEPPPPPGRGWPSGYPITLYAASLRVDEHRIEVDGSNTPLDHEFLSPDDPRAAGLLVDEFMLYTFQPLSPRTRYRVLIAGTRAGTRTRFEWTFTTR